MGMGSSAKNPQMLRFAAAVQTVEAVGVFVAAILALVDTFTGHSSTTASGMGLALLTFITAALVAVIGWGIAQVRPWSRTPAVMTQITIAIVAIVLIQGGRYDWGVPGLVLAAAGLAGLLNPASMRALVRD
jgi:uncharacterized oligopeptide transporter (OPT) family protein